MLLILIILLLLLWFFNYQEGLDEGADGEEDGEPDVLEEGLSIEELNTQVQVSETILTESMINTLEQLADKQNDHINDVRAIMASISAKNSSK
jgi:hypothetical protein